MKRRRGGGLGSDVPAGDGGPDEPSTSRRGGGAADEEIPTAPTRRFWENQGGKSQSLQKQGILRKLVRRECQNPPPSSAINVARRMCTDIYPSESCVAVKIPDFHVRAFTPDGRFLVCFSLNLKCVILYRYSREDHARPKDKASFETFLKKVFELEVVAEGESLCKTFSITAKKGSFLILGSSTKCMQHLNSDKMPTFERVTLHVIDLERGMKTDELTFEKDYIWLTQNNGISMYEDTLAVLSVKNQTIHFLHIDSLGKLVKIRSIGEFIYEDDEYTLSLHAMEGETDGRQAPPAAVGAPSTTARHGPEAGGGPEAGEGDQTDEWRVPSSLDPEVRPYSGIQQRLLGHLVTSALKAGGKPSENEGLKDFFFHFKEFQNLIMWKMQMLDGDHLLIKFDKSPFLGCSESQAIHGRYSGVFNIQSGKFVCFFLNRNEELAYLYQNFTDFFRVSHGDHRWSRFVSSYLNDQFLRAQLDKQRDRYNKIYGSEIEMSKQISSFLPLSPQMTNSSPYLDARLFQFDDRFVSPYNCHCPRLIAEHAIKFLSRGSNSSTRFKIDPFPVSDEEDEPQDDNYVTYVFHPVYPFAISCICNHLSPTPLIMKFYYR